jgi:hypothetical protein
MKNASKSENNFHSKSRSKSIKKKNLPDMKISRQNSKNINIVQRKLTIPKKIMEQYNTRNEDFSVVVQSMEDNKKRSNIELIPKNTVQLKDIITPSVCDDLRKTVTSKLREREKESLINETNFRSSFHLPPMINYQLDREIKKDSMNLIKYLAEKNEITEQFVKKLNQVDDEKINKLNKVCQIIFRNEESDKLYQENIKNVIKMNKIKEKREYSEKLNSMGENIEKFKNIIENNKVTFNNMDRYKNLHRDIEKHWSQTHVDKFFSKRKLGKSKSTIINNCNNYGNLK